MQSFSSYILQQQVVFKPIIEWEIGLDLPDALGRLGGEGGEVDVVIREN